MEDNIMSSYDLLKTEMLSWYEIAVKSLPNLVVAMIVILIFYFLSNLFKNISQRIVGKVSKNLAVTRLLSSLVQIGILLAGLFIALGIMDLDKTVTSLLAGAGVIGLVLGFAFQELSANFISGIFIAFNKPFGVGDVVQTGDHRGRVVRINLRSTVLKTYFGQDIFVPNKQLLTEPVINYTSDSKRLIELQVGVSYSDDLERVESTVLKALKGLEGTDLNRDAEVYFREFGDSSINFVVHYWINFPGDQNFYRSTHHAVKRIKASFDAQGITIPFPIRTLDLGIDSTTEVLNRFSHSPGNKTPGK